MSEDNQSRVDESLLRERQAVVEDFLRRWYRFARQLNRLDDPAESARLVEAALRDGLPPVPDGGVKAPREPARSVLLNAAAAVVAASGFLDLEDYRTEHALRPQLDPLRHYVDEGWRRLFAPSLRFDAWHYWSTYLDPTDERVMPLLHYLLVGRHDGLPALPERLAARPPTQPAETPRRVILFAAYDRDGLVDDYVVHYLSELARHGDVYYLADGVMEPGELDKISHLVHGAWSIPHGTYDFGSFSRLARDLVGWDVIEQYDELVLANDSCYLLRPLDEVFDRMDSRACDWWALQATSMQHDESYSADDSPIPLAEARRRFIGPRHWLDVQYLHLSSYFLVYRKPVFDDAGFRFRFDTVSGQREKMLVVHKYEVGISRYLVDQGFEFDTFLPDLHAFHPLYSRHFFDLVEQGFPLVKRNFLGENPRHVLDLDQWQERLRRLTPDAPLELMAANLERVSPVDRLHEAYLARVEEQTGVRVRPRRAKWGMAARTVDKESPTYDHWWAFATDPATGRLGDGVRAVFEQVRDDPSIHKVVLSRARRLDDQLTGERVSVLPLGTVEGQAALVRCRRLIVDAEPNVAFDLPLAPVRHDFVHTGLGLSSVPASASGTPGGEWRKLAGLAVSSPVEALLHAAADLDLPLAKSWLTGLPRHDFLVATRLPDDLAAEEERLRARLDGRPIVVWWPHRAGGFDLSDEDVRTLQAWARKRDVVVGVRERRVDRLGGLTRALLPLASSNSLLTLSARSTPWAAPVHRLASAVVTDGDPEALDALTLGTPVLMPSGQTGVAGDRVATAVAERDGWPSPLRLDSGVPALVAALDDAADGGFARHAWQPADDVVPLDGLAGWRLARRVRAFSRS